MKKSETYWFLIQAAVHVFLGVILVAINQTLTMYLPAYLGWTRPPQITSLALGLWLWPYFIAGIAATGALAAVVWTDRRRILLQLALALQVTSLLLMTITLCGYTIPFAHPTVLWNFKVFWGR